MSAALDSPTVFWGVAVLTALLVLVVVIDRLFGQLLFRFYYHCHGILLSYAPQDAFVSQLTKTTFARYVVARTPSERVGRGVEFAHAVRASPQSLDRDTHVMLAFVAADAVKWLLEHTDKHVAVSTVRWLLRLVERKLPDQQAMVLLRRVLVEGCAQGPDEAVRGLTLDSFSLSSASDGSELRIIISASTHPFRVSATSEYADWARATVARSSIQPVPVNAAVDSSGQQLVITLSSDVPSMVAQNRQP